MIENSANKQPAEKTNCNEKYIKADENGILIDVECTLSEILSNPEIMQDYRILKDTVDNFADLELKCQETVKSELMQDPFCEFYSSANEEMSCMRRGGEFCYAFLKGTHDYSIFGGAGGVKPTCVKNCPNQINMPKCMELLRKHDTEGAAKELFASNPFAAVTGRICTQICQMHCTRTLKDESVQIRNIERFLGDYILENYNSLLGDPPVISGKRIAVIGSGPAGLTAAFYLKELGHAVTVFEKRDRIGGVLSYGLPEFRLPKSVLEKIIDMLISIGIEFKTGDEVDPHMKIEDYRANYHGVFVGCGASGQKSAQFEGASNCISYGDFLKGINENEVVSVEKKIIVIGEHISSIDAALSAIRLGGEEINIICESEGKELKTYEWEISQATLAGVNFICGKVLSVDKNHNVKVMTAEGEKVFSADTVICANDQIVELNFIKDTLKLTDDGKIFTDIKTCETNIGGVYAAGDSVTGSSSVIEAIAGGRKSAAALNSYLCRAKNSDRTLKKLPAQEGQSDSLRFDLSCLKSTKGLKLTTIEMDNRTLTAEDTFGYDEADAEKEAKRCFNCGCVAVHSSELATALIALDAKYITSKRQIEAADFYSGKANQVTILGEGEDLLQIYIPKPPEGSTLIYKKSKGASIAMNSFVRDNVVYRTRIALGGVSPIPYRAKKAEFIFFRKIVNSETAEIVAEATVKEALPLFKNEYKVQLVRDLIKDAINLHETEEVKNGI